TCALPIYRRLRPMRLLAISTVLVCGLIASSAALGSDDEVLVDQGLALRREHRDSEALEQFRQAAQVRRAPRTVAQIALAEQALGQWVDAERDLMEALGKTDDAWIGTRQQVLRASLDAIREHLASLSLEANVPGAELWLDDRRIGILPVGPLRVPSGTVRIEVRSTGYETLHRSLDIAPGQMATAKFDLTPVVAAAPSPTSEKRPVAVTTTLSPASPATGSTQRFIAWGMLGAAGAFLGTALAAQGF